MVMNDLNLNIHKCTFERRNLIFAGYPLIRWVGGRENRQNPIRTHEVKYLSTALTSAHHLFLCPHNIILFSILHKITIFMYQYYKIKFKLSTESYIGNK